MSSFRQETVQFPSTDRIVSVNSPSSSRQYTQIAITDRQQKENMLTRA